MTQKELAKRAGLSVSTIRRAEASKRLSESSFKKLAAVFGVDPEELKLKTKPSNSVKLEA